MQFSPNLFLLLLPRSAPLDKNPQKQIFDSLNPKPKQKTLFWLCFLFIFLVCLVLKRKFLFWFLFQRSLRVFRKGNRKITKPKLWNRCVGLINRPKKTLISKYPLPKNRPLIWFDDYFVLQMLNFIAFCLILQNDYCSVMDTKRVSKICSWCCWATFKGRDQRAYREWSFCKKVKLFYIVSLFL